MKRRKFLAAVPGLAIVFCARNEKRPPRYDPGECPFCKGNRGVCRYCQGTKKCGFCAGRGKRTVTVPDLRGKGIAASKREETCPHCNGTGVCRYCEGKGTCWACGGSGRIDSWDFYSKSKMK